MFMMKNKKLSFQNMQVASDVINLKIISVKNANLNTKNAEITNYGIMRIFNQVATNKQ